MTITRALPPLATLATLVVALFLAPLAASTAGQSPPVRVVALDAPLAMRGAPPPEKIRAAWWARRPTTPGPAPGGGRKVISTGLEALVSPTESVRVSAGFTSVASE